MSREHLAVDLRTYGEEELAERALTATEAEMQRIGERGAELAYTGMLIAKAVALAAIEVFEGRSRLPRWSRRKLKGIYPDEALEPKRISPAGTKTAAPLIKEVHEIIREELATLGLRRRGDIGLFTVDLGLETLGWLGLGRRTGRGEGWFDLYPTVGVVHEPLERLWAELAGRKYQVNATIGTPLAYLMPEKTYRVWTFSPEVDNRAVVLDMKLAIETYGIPYMRENGTTAALLQNLPVAGLKDFNPYRLPLLHHLSGDNAAAKREIQRALDGLQAREGSGARDYREFAAKLLGRIDNAQDGPR